MRKFIYIITLILFTVVSVQSQQDEWTYLFDGKTLNGWHEYNGTDVGDAWSVQNGELVLASKNDNLSRGNDIVTDEIFTDFELSLEWNISKGGNSGVFFKVVEIPEVNEPYKTGPEIQVLDNDNFSVNANDISNKTITIPYTGSDNRTYRLSLTISSTKDFSENFSGETYASVRRVAPRSYYAQDRMVNAQDYNVYPLTLGNNVVNKVKAVNTSFAGNSRFYETDDVLGHHSNLSITGSDGSVFVEDEPITISLSYNKSKGNSDNFIRNEISNAIKHPSLLNKFLHPLPLQMN